MMDYLEHYGTKRHSGRYPYGSGEDPYQHDGSSAFLKEVARMRASKMTDTEIARELGVSTGVFRARVTRESEADKAYNRQQAIKLRDEKQMSVKAIAQQLGVSEGTVRNYLNPSYEFKKSSTVELANYLEDSVKKYGYIDVGSGVESRIGIAKTKLDASVDYLKEQGYSVVKIQVPQVMAANSMQKTQMVVLCPPGTTAREIYQNHLDEIVPPEGLYFDSREKTLRNIEPPVPVDPGRVLVVWGEDGGKDKDGLIELRRGTEDLTLGDSMYAQVRIQVGPDKYLKGMAVYSDDLPEGVDIRFNTNKHKDDPEINGDPMQALKPLKDDLDNPFKSLISKQIHYTDAEGNDVQSPINIVREEGQWQEWSKSLSSQILSKQPLKLVKEQLGIAYDRSKEEYDDIMGLTNDTLKQQFLLEFADECDKKASTLKAAEMNRQAYHVLLPCPTLKDNEVYAPDYEDGETLVLIRSPHAGVFEIPELKVNNKNKEAIAMMGKNPKDAIGVNPRTLQQLSGADCDGDTVLTIPNNDHKIKTQEMLKELENFSTTDDYKAYPGMPKSDADHGFHTQVEMGKISNLITDMTVRNASQEDIVKAVKHSMVIIDAEKHNLDWRRSYQENNIEELKRKYQGVNENGSVKGASTLISLSNATKYVPERSLRYRIDPETGKKIYQETGAQYTDKKGKVVVRQSKTTNMAEVDDAHELSTGTAVENVYADYANSMKALAQQSRITAINTPSAKYSPSAKKTYADEVSSLNAKLAEAKKNRPLERQAQLRANIIIKAKVADNPAGYADKDEYKKLKRDTLSYTRDSVGASRFKWEITDREMEAINAGAVSSAILNQILKSGGSDAVKAKAMPKQKETITDSQIARIRAYAAKGKTNAQIAAALGVSTSTVSKYARN